MPPPVAGMLAGALRRRIGMPRSRVRVGVTEETFGGLVEMSLRADGTITTTGIGGNRRLPPPSTPAGAGGGIGGFRLGAVRVREAAVGELASPLTRILTRRPLRELHTDPMEASRVADLRGYALVREVDFATGVAQQHREADFLRRILGQAVPEAGERAAPEMPDVAQEAQRFATSMRFAVSVPGRHYSGLANEELLTILAGQGRDFLADTSELRVHVREKIEDALGTDWNEREARDIAADAVREWIVQRFERQGVDVDLAPLNDVYRRWKSRSRYSTMIGIKTGALLGAVKRAAVRVS